MDIKIGFTKELTNTSYAPLAALFAHYQRNNPLEPLHQVQIPMQKRDFEPHSKLKQVLMSIWVTVPKLVNKEKGNNKGGKTGELLAGYAIKSAKRRPRAR